MKNVIVCFVTASLCIQSIWGQNNNTSNTIEFYSSTSITSDSSVEFYVKTISKTHIKYVQCVSNFVQNLGSTRYWKLNKNTLTFNSTTKNYEQLWDKRISLVPGDNTFTFSALDSNDDWSNYITSSNYTYQNIQPPNHQAVADPQFVPLTQPEQGFTNKTEAKNQTVNGLRQGKWIDYGDSNMVIITNSNAAVYYALSVYDAGKIIGISRAFYMSGKLRYETPYSNGKANGVKKIYYESGKLSAEFTYIDGKLDGIAKGYFENGKLMIESPYSEGKKNGIEKQYYESGKLQYETPYINDVENGVENWYYENGQLHCVTPYKNDKENGLCRYYYESGKLKEEVPYNDGDVDGLDKIYYESGQLKETLEFSYGYSSGKDQLYNEDGSKAN